jgi:hypothetical protein
VTIADGHLGFIQPKSNVEHYPSAWDKPWQDFDEEYFDPHFERGRDRLCLRTAQAREDHVALEELCERAGRARSFGMG